MDAREKIARYIEQDPDTPGIEGVRLRESMRSVWMLAAAWKAAGGDIARVADAYGVTPDDVSAVVAYYQLHADEIDSRIAALLAATA